MGAVGDGVAVSGWVDDAGRPHMSFPGVGRNYPNGMFAEGRIVAAVVPGSGDRRQTRQRQQWSLPLGAGVTVRNSATAPRSEPRSCEERDPRDRHDDPTMPRMVRRTLRRIPQTHPLSISLKLALKLALKLGLRPRLTLTLRLTETGLDARPCLAPLPVPAGDAMISCQQ